MASDSPTRSVLFSIDKQTKFMRVEPTRELSSLGDATDAPQEITVRVLGADSYKRLGVNFFGDQKIRVLSPVQKVNSFRGVSS